MSEERPAGLEEAPGTADDAVIERTVRRKLQERPDLQAGGLVIDVVRGVAYLRGDLSDRHGIDEIVDLTSAVPGVRRVQSLLHLPETETISRPDAKPLGDAWNG
jgi:osmotically-inducible protein OsmY